MEEKPAFSLEATPSSKRNRRFLLTFCVMCATIKVSGAIDFVLAGGFVVYEKR